MFRKKLLDADIFPRGLCSCCWASKPRRDSDVPGKQQDKTTGEDVKLSELKDKDAPEAPRTAGDGESVSLTGAAYAYEDETSSDSDDEVLKRFKSSMEASAAIKRSGSRYSQKATHSPTHVPQSQRKVSTPNGSLDKVTVDNETRRSPEKVATPPGPKVGKLIDMDSPVHQPVSPSRVSYGSDSRPSSRGSAKQLPPDTRRTSRGSAQPLASPHSASKESIPYESESRRESRVSSQGVIGSTKQGSGSASPMHESPSPTGAEEMAEASGSMRGSITTGSAHTLEGTITSGQAVEGTQTFDNKAYDGVSVSAHEHPADEHMFDVSDLQNDVPLISKCGNLEVTFSYTPHKSRMEVTIHQAQDIPTKERGGANNTQVRLLLLPTKKQRHKTRVKQGENPTFEETFVFSKVSEEDVTSYGIRFRLYGVERMRRERMIGESIIGFASLSLDTPSTHWVVLEPRSNLSQGDSNADVASLSDSASSTQSLQHGGMPELLLGLAYNGTTGRLSVEVIKGSNFRNMAMNRAPDTYVKLTLIAPNGKEVAHSKTSVRRGQPNPLFKETFMFQVALFQLADVTLMVSVYNKKSMKKKEMIGWFALGLNSSGEEESSHWTDMRESKGDNVCRWHVLLES